MARKLPPQDAYFSDLKTELRPLRKPKGGVFIPPPTPDFWPEEPGPDLDPEDNTWMGDLRWNGNSVRPFQSNAEIVLETSCTYAGSLAFDTFEGRVKLLRAIPGGGQAGSVFGEEHLLALRVWCETHLDVGFPLPLLSNAVKAVAMRNRRHVIQRFLDRLEWDGQDRISHLHDHYFGAEDTDYNRAITKRFLISAVARAYRPGAKADACLVMEGGQGTYKSTSLRVLFMNDQWVNDTPLDLRSKDGHIGLQGRWVVEFAELDALSKADTARVKAFLSLDRDRIRMPYEVNVREFPRTCIFVGTVNESAYLRDTTGGRRFWPLVIGDIDLNALARDREQLWAEAVHLYKQGEVWHLTYEEELLAREEQDIRRIESPMEAPMRSYLARRKDTTIDEILKDALDLKLYRANGREGRQVAQILTGVFGWRRTKVKRDGIRVSGFVAPVVQAEAPTIDEDDDAEMD
ncbi:virulence-associated E family protein [Geothrix paludis]|uniref:virulence-associated E family protein n=1 Tax=Geothrix paludis TaxID=2922722 RepID=UPI001FAD8863|nr:virulence-associated E family protein [Geothrix paludis]